MCLMIFLIHVLDDFPLIYVFVDMFLVHELGCVYVWGCVCVWGVVCVCVCVWGGLQSATHLPVYAAAMGAHSQHVCVCVCVWGGGYKVQPTCQYMLQQWVHIASMSVCVCVCVCVGGGVTKCNPPASICCSNGCT